MRPEYIKVNDLRVDPDVQRSLRTAYVDKLAREFDEGKLGALSVATAGSNGHFHYHVCDGQHRVAAMRKLGLGERKVLCINYGPLSKKDQATLFLGLNDSKKVRAFDTFRVRVQEGDPTATGIVSILDEVGLALSDQKTDGAVRAVIQLEAIYSGRALRLKDGPFPHALRWTLSTLKDAWGYEANAFDGELIEGLGLVMLRFGDRVDRDRFGKKLAAYPGGPRALIAKSRAWKDLKGTTLKNATAELLVSVYNAQLRVNALPAWERAS
jgi:hypothetical protein